jgi:hypothetical protein
MNLSSNLLNKFEWSKNTLTFLTCLILLIWCIPNTIALRNGLLLLGAVNASYLIFSCRHQFGSLSKKYLPLVLLGCLYLWAAIHYVFFSHNPSLELKELQSIWSRAFAGSLIAIALPLCLIGNQRRSKIFFIFLFSTPIINILLYINACFVSGYVITPQEYVAGFVFKKIETVFFGSVATAIAVANLITMLKKNDKSHSNENLNTAFWLLGIVLCFISAVLSNTKNGILIGLFVIFIASGYLFLCVIRSKVNSQASAIFALGLVLFSLGTWKVHDHFSTGGWRTLVADIQVGLDTENHREWNMENSGKFLPFNELGEKVSGSTYMRVAWAKVGIGLIKEYPLGYGSINSSYDGLTNLSGIDPGKHGQTHSGWVDLGLAYGLPGVFLLAGALICILFLALVAPSFWALQAFFIALAFFPLALIAEITWKQYFEATLFFATFASTLVLMRNTLVTSPTPKR